MGNLSNKKEIEGILVVDKPEGWTSFDVVRKIKKLLNIKKVGHTGTLDPMATGVLPLCLGKATKIARFITESQKNYEGVILFGIETDTYDITGQVIQKQPLPSKGFDQEHLQQAAQKFQGKILQVPPPYSALKHNGVPLYKLARKGINIQKAPREIQIKKFDIQWVRGNEAGFKVECTKGTYVRSLIHDLGRSINNCACLKALRRLSSGSFGEQDAWTLEDIESAVLENRIEALIVPVSQALSHIPQVEIDYELARDLRYGRPVVAARLYQLLDKQRINLDSVSSPSYLRLVLKEQEGVSEKESKQLVSVIQWLASRPYQNDDRLKTLKVWQ